MEDWGDYAGGLPRTNSHVVQGCSKIGIFKNKLMYPVALHSKDDSMDIAILKADRDLTNSFVRFASETRNGEDVRALGFPEIGALGTSMKITTGNIASMSTPDGDNKYLQFTAPIQGGNSGGPLVNKFNGVVGMVTATLRGVEYQNVNFAVKGWNIQNYLAANRIRFDVSTAKKELDGPTIAETSEKHVRLVFCDLR